MCSKRNFVDFKSEIEMSSLVLRKRGRGPSNQHRCLAFVRPTLFSLCAIFLVLISSVGVSASGQIHIARTERNNVAQSDDCCVANFIDDGGDGYACTCKDDKCWQIDSNNDPFVLQGGFCKTKESKEPEAIAADALNALNRLERLDAKHTSRRAAGGTGGGPAPAPAPAADDDYDDDDYDPKC